MLVLCLADRTVLHISGSLDKCLLTRISLAFLCGWSVFCCEECCLLWVSHRASVAAVTDAGLSVVTESRDIQPTHTGPDTSV